MVILSDLNRSIVTMVNNMNTALRTRKQVLKMRERKNGQTQQWDIFSTASQRSVITRKSVSNVTQQVREEMQYD